VNAPLLSYEEQQRDRAFVKRSNKENRRERNSFKKMDILREAMTQMSSTGQPLSTKKRWMVIDKKIVFGNGVIPSDHTGDAIIYILKNIMPRNIYHRRDEMANKMAQAITKTGVYDYPDLIMVSWNNINWVYDLNLNTEEQKLLSLISAYSLYFTSIGDVDKALDPMQWDYESINNWKYNYYKYFMVYEMGTKLTPFGMSVLPTPKLMSTISIASTTTTTTTTIPTVNSEMMYIFDVGLEYVVTNWLYDEAADNIVRLMLQDNSIKTFREFVDMDRNIINTYRICQLLRYINCIYNNNDYNLAEDPTQWTKRDFADWERNGEPQFADSTTPHRIMEDNRIQSWRIATVIVPIKDKRIVPTKEIISSSSIDNDNSQEEELEEDDDFDTGMIHVLTRILDVPL